MPYTVAPTGSKKTYTCPPSIDNASEALDHYAENVVGIARADGGKPGTTSFYQDKRGAYHVKYTDRDGSVLASISAHVRYER